MIGMIRAAESGYLAGASFGFSLMWHGPIGICFLIIFSLVAWASFHSIRSSS